MIPPTITPPNFFTTSAKKYTPKAAIISCQNSFSYLMVRGRVPPQQLRRLDGGRVPRRHPGVVPRAHDGQVVEQPRAHVGVLPVARPTARAAPARGARGEAGHCFRGRLSLVLLMAVARMAWLCRDLGCCLPK